MKMKIVGEYSADKGTFVLNGIGFSNGFGDGSFDIYFDGEEYNREVHGEDICWFDFRNTAKDTRYSYNKHDCEDKVKELDFNDMQEICEAMVMTFDGRGNVVFRKYF